MKKEMGRFFGRFFLGVFFVLVLTLFAYGSITVSEKGKYDLYYEKYAVLSFENTAEKIEMGIEEKSLILNKPTKEQRKKTEKLLLVTPLSPLVVLYEEIESLVSGIDIE